MENIINWWNNLDPLTSEEKDLLSKCLCHVKNDRLEKTKMVKDFESMGLLNDVPLTSSEEDFIKLTDEFFSRMPNCNCTHLNKDLSFNSSCTAFINMLFDRLVDNDTLIITSDNEHPSLKKKIEEYPNKMILNHYTDIRQYNIDKIIRESVKYKEVFVYIIGTRNDTGEITPQDFFIELKKAFIKNNIKHTIVLDDVQGMFVVPRDYSMFDYVLGTGHAMVNNYDLGIMISNSYFGGYKAYNWGKDYLERLDILLKRQNKMNIFKQLLEQYYSKELDKNSNRAYAQRLSTPFIFYMKLENKIVSEEVTKLLSKINLLLPANTHSPTMFFRLRSHWFLLDNTLLPKCIKVIRYILDNDTIDIEAIRSMI